MTSAFVTQVWIASHLSSENQTKWLCEAIKSCKELTVVIALSGDEDYISKFIANFADIPISNRHVIHVRNKRSQFDHLSFLYQISKLNDQDVVIFLDDDDLLLNPYASLPEDKDAHLGYQYMGMDEKGIFMKEVNEEINFDNKEVIIACNNLKKEYDFSGTMARFIHIKHYFTTQREGYISPVEDVHFMTYLEDLPNFHTLENPNVFRRLKNTPSGWQIEVADIIREQSAAIVRLKETVNVLEKKLTEKEIEEMNDNLLKDLFQ